MTDNNPQLKDGIYTIESAHSVDAIMDKLEAALTAKGIGIVARVDHAANAGKVDLDLPATQVLIFGNPKLGTPLIQAAPSMALDLPMKMMASGNASGATVLSWIDPAHLKSFHNVEGCDEIVSKMSNALKAIAAEVVV